MQSKLVLRYLSTSHLTYIIHIIGPGLPHFSLVLALCIMQMEGKNGRDLHENKISVQDVSVLLQHDVFHGFSN